MMDRGENHDAMKRTETLGQITAILRDLHRDFEILNMILLYDHLAGDIERDKRAAKKLMDLTAALREVKLNQKDLGSEQ